MTATGLSGVIAGGLGSIGGDNPMVALAAVFMFPIALVLAGNLGVSFMPFAVTLMVGASCSFISPMGYQTNLMVYGPGRCRFGDYVKMGVPLSVLVGVITLLLAPFFFPF